MPRCPARALPNIRAVRLCAKRKTMAMERDAKDLARGIARADWLQFSSEKQKQKRRDREKGETHPPIRGAGRAPTHTTTNSHPKSLPKTRTNTLTQTQRTLIFITIIWLFYHTQNVHDITTSTSSLSLLRPSFSIQEAQVRGLRGGHCSCLPLLNQRRYTVLLRRRDGAALRWLGCGEFLLLRCCSSCSCVLRGPSKLDMDTIHLLLFRLLHCLTCFGESVEV